MANSSQHCLAESEKHRRTARTGCSWPATTAAECHDGHGMNLAIVEVTLRVTYRSILESSSIIFNPYSISQLNPYHPYLEIRCESSESLSSESPTGSSSQSCNINTVESSPVTSSCAVTWRSRGAVPRCNRLRHGTVAPKCENVAKTDVSLRSRRRGH